MTDLIERYGAGKFRYASPGNNQLPVWMLRFLDKDMREAIFTGADAEQQAWEAWNRYAPAFNCYLLCSAELTPALEARDAEITRLVDLDALNEAVIIAVENALDAAGAPRRSGSLILGLPARIAALTGKDDPA